jgi:hypothetical protein
VYTPHLRGRKKISDRGPVFIPCAAIFVHPETEFFVIRLKRTVITLDARNHGESPHANSMSYEDMTEDVVAFMEDCGLEKGILLGHSMGGKEGNLMSSETTCIFIDVRHGLSKGVEDGRRLPTLWAAPLKRPLVSCPQGVEG